MSSTSNRKQLLLLDADILVYQSVAAVEREIQFDEDLFVLFSSITDAKDAFTDKLNTILESVGPCDTLFCLSDSHNFRKDLDPSYKAHRKAVRKPMAFKELRDWVKETYQTVSKPNLEADDCLGILATKPGNEHSIIWSIDKDLMQIPGSHLVDGELVLVTEDEGDYVHFMQTLTGDPSDGYKGCPGMGAVKAAKALRPYYVDHSLHRVGAWGAICFAYEEAGLTFSDALLQARLARILRWDEWDATNQIPILWEPLND